MKKQGIVKKVLALAIAAGMSLSLLACGSGGDSNTLIIYSGLHDFDTTALAEAFTEETGIEVEFIVGNIGDLTARVDAESDNPQADILIGGSAELYDPIRDSLQQYTSPLAEEIDSRFNDPYGYWQGWFTGVLAILYNTDRFEAEMAPLGVQPPETWDDLLDPAWEGEFLMGDPATAGGARIFIANQIFRLGEEEAWQFMEELDNNVHHYTPGAVTPIDMVGQGEFLIGMSWAHPTLDAIEEGQPITMVIPPYTAYEIGAVAILAGAPNVENAQLFIDWLLSREAQELNVNLANRYSVRSDVDSPGGMPLLEDISLVDYDRPAAGAMMTDMVEIFQERIQGH